VALQFEAELLEIHGRRVVIRSESRRNADDTHIKMPRVGDMRPKDSDPLTVLIDLAGKWWKMTDGKLKIHFQHKISSGNEHSCKGGLVVWYVSSRLSG